MADDLVSARSVRRLRNIRRHGAARSSTFTSSRICFTRASKKILTTDSRGAGCRRPNASRAREALEWAGLTDRRDVPPHKLSDGEKQRVALARARVLDPTHLLLDEPTANLDGDARRQVLELVTALCIDNHTVVVASHDPEIIRLAILNRLYISDRRIKSDD